MLKRHLHLDILPQPDPTTCGPTCLHAVYRYFGDELPLEQVIAETPRLPTGGTFAVQLANHALHRGYDATIYTYDLQVFDPTWFSDRAPALKERLARQLGAKSNVRLRAASHAYQEFLDLGGKVRFDDLTPNLIRRYLKRQIPILTGLSATYLYRTMREVGESDEPDDVRGEPAGHFVVLCGYDKKQRQVLVADPMQPNPVSSAHEYVVSLDRLIGSILLGILTYDGNMLIIEPREDEAHATGARDGETRSQETRDVGAGEAEQGASAAREAAPRGGDRRGKRAGI